MKNFQLPLGPVRAPSQVVKWLDRPQEPSPSPVQPARTSGVPCWDPWSSGPPSYPPRGSEAVQAGGVGSPRRLMHMMTAPLPSKAALVTSDGRRRREDLPDVGQWGLARNNGWWLLGFIPCIWVIF